MHLCGYSSAVAPLADQSTIPLYCPRHVIKHTNDDIFSRSRPIVHRAGGMLLQSKKEFVICADLQPHDVFFYYTTTYVILIRISVIIQSLSEQWMDDVEFFDKWP